MLNKLPHKCGLARSSKSYVLDIRHCSTSHGVKKGVVLLRVQVPQFTSYLESLGLAVWGGSCIETLISIQEREN